MDGTLATAGTTTAMADNTGGTYQLATSGNVTTAAITNALRFAQSKSVRTSTIILASFNTVAAFTTALGIIYGCRSLHKRMQRRASEPSVLRYEWKSPTQLTSSRPSGLFFIHTIEIFPLVLCLGITIQSITFAAAQSVGLQALLSRGCTLVAVFMLPGQFYSRSRETYRSSDGKLINSAALFIVPFTHLVFGVEAAFRGVRSQFAPRGRWNVAKCLGTVGILTLLALIVAAVARAPDFCFASLFWFLRVYAPGCFGVFVAISVILLIAIGTIFLRLNNSHMVDPTERTAASRMIYYLVLGFISNVRALAASMLSSASVLTRKQAFIIPFFFSLTFLDQEKVIRDTINLSMVASVVSNVNGLMVAGLHLFHRSQSNCPIGNNMGEYERKNYLYDPRDRRDDYRGSNHSLRPVNGQNNQARGRSDSNTNLLHLPDAEAGSMVSPRSLASPKSYGTTAARSPFSPKISIPSGPKYPEPTQPPSETSPSQIRKQSYSVFPQDTPTAAAAGVLPATTYSPLTSKPARDTWKPPPIVKPWVPRGHKRDSSITSTATVQIGIRLSNVDDYIPRKSTDTDVPDIPAVPDVSQMPTMPQLPVGRSPLAEVETRSASEYESEYTDTEIILDDPPRTRSVRDARMKTLPPVPTGEKKTVTAAAQSEVAEPANMKEELAEEWVTLAPVVYSPKEESRPQRSGSSRSAKRLDAIPQRSDSNRSARKLPSPMGVGFNTPNRSPAHAPPRPSAAGTVSAATTPLTASATKADWI